MTTEILNGISMKTIQLYYPQVPNYHEC